MVRKRGKKDYEKMSEEELWRLKGEGDLSARNEIVRRYMGLARNMAQAKIGDYMANVMLEDLISYAYTGLIKAVDGYDPNRGTKFSTYCRFRIWGKLNDYFRKEGWQKRVERIVRDRVLAAEAKLRKERGVVSFEEVAEEVGLPVEEVAWYLTSGGMFYSVEDITPPPEDGDRLSLADVMADKRTMRPDELAEQKDMLRAVLDRLGETERRVVEGKLINGWSIGEISRRLKVSAARVSQIYRHAVSLARRFLAEEMAGERAASTTRNAANR